MWTLFRNRSLSVFFIFPVLAVPAIAEEAARPTIEDRLARLERRVEQLERENRELRTQVATLAPPAGSRPAELASALPAPGAAAAQPASVGDRTLPAPQVSAVAARGEERKPAGFDLGPWTAIPQGIIFFNLFGNTGGNNNADIPLFASSGDASASASVRQTRLGLRLVGPRVAGADLNGIVETDFLGGFPSVGVGEPFPLIRLRLAYARMEWEKTTLTVGQDWMIFSPNNPVSIASAAIPQLVTAGNLWQRLPQIRVERRGGSDLKWVGQAAVVMPGTGDFPNTPAAFFLQPGAGARSRLPHFQARVGATSQDWLGHGKPAVVGVSGHYGRARVTVASADHNSDVFGTALDWSLPIAPRLTLAGEAFLGRNLAGFQGGVFQGINPDFALRQDGVVIPAGVRGIGTRGGWAQLGFAPPGQDNLTFYASYGLDDPRDGDLLSTPARDWRSRNTAFALSFIHKLSPQFNWGLEFRRMETQSLLSGKRTNNHLNLGASATF
jgi:hypothetical protein